MHATIRPKPPSHLLLQRVPDLPLFYRHQAMIVAVRVMDKVQMSVHKEIRVVAMRHGFVAAIGAMAMRGLVALTGV